MLKEHVLTLLAGLATLATIITFTMISRPIAETVFDGGTILFEHRVQNGKVAIAQNYDNQLSLAYFNRNTSRFDYKDSHRQLVKTDVTHLVLPSSEDVPFTTHAIVSTAPDIHEIIVIETGFPIAHHAFAKETLIETTSVFMVASSDFNGEDFLVVGLDINGDVLFEITP